MDPNATLETIREQYATLRLMLDDTNGNLAEAAEDLLDAIQDLDGWLSKGGFLPNDWQR